jgi:hypothetical protein
MKTIWTYITTLFAGIIAGLVIFLKLDGPETVINDNTRIGKIKQRGQGNSAAVTVDPEPIVAPGEPDTGVTRKEARLLRRLARIRERQDKKESG